MIMYCTTLRIIIHVLIITGAILTGEYAIMLYLLFLVKLCCEIFVYESEKVQIYCSPWCVFLPNKVHERECTLLTSMVVVCVAGNLESKHFDSACLGGWQICRNTMFSRIWNCMKRHKKKLIFTTAFIGGMIIIIIMFLLCFSALKSLFTFSIY